MSWLASMGGNLKQHAAGTILRVSRGFVFNIGDRASLAVAAQQLHHAVAILAAKLGVTIFKCGGDRLHLPERLIASANFHATTFHFALIDFFAFDCHYCPVPPTVMRSSFTVGMPTPTGTLCPALPQVPMPSSSARSLPTIDTYFNASGPLPVTFPHL